MAIGGDHNQHTLDSMETYDPAVGQWVIVGALPKPLESLKAINIDGRILLFGKITTLLVFCETKNFRWLPKRRRDCEHNLGV